MNRKNLYETIVVGGNHHNALGIIRSLGEVGYCVNYISTNSNKSFVSKSKYVKKFRSAENEVDIINTLLYQFKIRDKRPIIIPSDDYATGVIDTNISKLKDHFIIPNVSMENGSITKLMNKFTMNRIAEKCGFLVPRSVIINLSNLNITEGELKKHKIDFPCILKPQRSLDGTKTDIVVCNNSNELLTQLSSLKEIYEEVIIQEYINKDFELGIQGFSLPDNKEVIIPGIVEKIRDSAVSPGSTTYANLMESHQLVDKKKISKLIKSINYYGIFDLELMVSNGEVYFIELNFRNGAYGYAYTKAGVNIPHLWCLNSISEDIEHSLNKVSSITFMNEFADFRNILSKNINLFRWIKELLKTDVYLIFNKKDFKPFIYKFIYR